MMLHLQGLETHLHRKIGVTVNASTMYRLF